MLWPHRGAYECNGIAFKKTLHITRRVTGYRERDKGTKEIKKGRKEIKNEDVEESTPRLIPAVPSDLHIALLTKMFSHQDVLSKNCCDTRCYATTSQLILLHRIIIINIRHSSVGTVTGRVLISGKGNRFFFLRRWDQATRPIQRMPAALAAWRHVKVEVEGHVVLVHHTVLRRAQTPISISFSKFLSSVCLWTMSSVRS